MGTLACLTVELETFSKDKFQFQVDFISMALECQEIGEGLSSKKCINNLLNKELPLPDIRSHSHFPLPFSNASRKPQNKSISRKLPLCSSSGNQAADVLSSCGQRSISDLPSALISEILKFLNAQEFGIVSCVSTQLNSLACDHKNWKAFYLERWGPPPASNPSSKSWRELFIEKQFRAKSFLGRFSIDTLRGHTEAVRSVFLLPLANLIFSGGYDSIVRMWDMEEGLLVASSRPLGCTIRAIAADHSLMVAGGTNGFLQCWRALVGHINLFDIASGNHSRLWGHEGPVTCLALDSDRIFSGSWDMSIRIWDRTRLKWLKTIRHRDWVWALTPHGGTIASTAGRDVYVWDIDSGKPITVISSSHLGNVPSLARSYEGNLLFSGGEDGVIHMFDLNGQIGNGVVKPILTWNLQIGSVLSLAFEFPWLVSSSSNGRIALIDVGMFVGSSKKLGASGYRKVVMPQRTFHGFGCNLFSIAIGGDGILCVGDEGVVRVWNFSEALEIEKRVQALRRARLKNRTRRRKTPAKLIAWADKCVVVAESNQDQG